MCKYILIVDHGTEKTNVHLDSDLALVDKLQQLRARDGVIRISVYERVRSMERISVWSEIEQQEEVSDGNPEEVVQKDSDPHQ